MALNLDAKISKYFTLRDLTKTGQGTANIPNAAELKQLTILAGLLDRLFDEVGPFTVLSAFRSEATQAKLKTTETAAAKKKSFHELGMAADITPKNTDIFTYWLKVIDLPWVKKGGLGEIALKTPQNAVHISNGVKGFKEYVLMEQDVAKNYMRVSPARLAQIRKNYGANGAVVASVRGPASLFSSPNAALYLGGGLLALAAFYMLMSGDQAAVRSNPYLSEKEFRREHERLLKVLSKCRNRDAKKEYRMQIAELKGRTNPRPPKEWFDKMTLKIKAKSPDLDSASVRAVIGAIWYKRLSPAKKREIMDRLGDLCNV